MSCPNPHCQASLPPAAKACPACRLPLPGVLHLGRYAITGILHRGEHLFHYQAIDRQTDRTVEVRVLVAPEPNARGIFLAEARTVMGLDVPELQHVLAVHEEGLASAVLEGMGDRTSRDLMPYGERDLLMLALQAAGILRAVHDQGVLHRDVRPEHLRLDLKRHLTLAGWGWERMLAARLGMRIERETGARDYMAPELATRDAGPRSDLYGLGMTLVHLATGLEPARLYQEGTYRWREHARLSQPFQELVDALIQPQPGRRLGSARELERRLQALLPPDLVEAAEAAEPPQLPAWVSGTFRKLEGLGIDPRLAWLVALLAFLFPMLPAVGPGEPRPFKWTFTTVGDRQALPARPRRPGPPERAPHREVRLAGRYARALLHRPATVSLVPLRPAEAQGIPTTWTPPDPAEPVAWEIRVSQAHHVLEVYRDSLRVMAFSVGLGAHGSTPVGRFEITRKVERPVYRRPDGTTIPAAAPDNPLGTRWMGLEVPGRTGLGIHGTPHLDSIGDDMSLGCIRMRPGDVERLYQAIPAHTWVSIEP